MLHNPHLRRAGIATGRVNNAKTLDRLSFAITSNDGRCETLRLLLLCVLSLLHDRLVGEEVEEPSAAHVANAAILHSL